MTVQINGLTAGYDGKSPVLKEINIEIGGGHICGLLGRNGSGKTTLMRCINAILRPMHGQVLVMDKDVAFLSRTSIARLISFVPQSSYTVFSFSCLEMVLMGCVSRLKLWASPGPAEITKARQVFEEVGIAELTDMSFNHLSGGQQQLVMLARALYQEAPVMLLDEPSSHLDFCNQHKVMSLMRQIVKLHGATALITLHDPNLALHYCDEVVMLHQGEVIANGPTGETLNNANLRRVFGDNIQTDTTSSGFQVVVPQYIA